MKLWKLAEPVTEDAHATLAAYPRLLASLLWRRGIRSREAAERFLDPVWERDVHDPLLFNDMRKAVSRLMAAIERGEKIVVHGDYDADGVSGSVILHATLKRLGGRVEVFIPHREKEGYGIAMKTIERLADEGVKVMITCDCGISNSREIARAGELGMDVIITDHHTIPPDVPAAHAILHPLREGEGYPFRHLTGGGVAFKLCQALLRAGGAEAREEKLLVDMVSISTVADYGRLEGENRALVRFGLMLMNGREVPRRGLRALLGTTRIGERKVGAEDIGFQIAPRINAAGRMDHARHAFDLLSAEDEPTALRQAEILHQHNNDRRAATETLVAKARLLSAEQKDDAAIVVAGDGWPAALCGLIAARLVDDRARPVIAVGKNEEGNYVGSGRSVPGFDVTEGVRAASESVLKFGGHPAACGLTIEGDEKYEAFKKAFKKHAETALRGMKLEPTLSIEETAAVEDIDLKTLELLERLEPHGEGNPKPLFLLKNVRPAMVTVVGEGGKHLRVTTVGHNGNQLKLIGFSLGARAQEAQGAFDAVVELSINEWNGRREPQGRIIDFRTAA